jgi:mono/diheme cytochrome c family protein
MIGRLATALLLVGSLGLIACGKSDNPRARGKSVETASGPGGAEAVAAANQIFASRCTPCHGSTGGGDGPASGSLNPHPRNFHDVAWQKAVDDDHIGKIVQYGGAAVGKSPNMPANPDLQDKPLVVQALVHKVRGFAAR